ncbi:hypothetical protein XP73_23600, partial [Salmonella enterica]|nr:hypothetical protein [Salmonella enterica]
PLLPKWSSIEIKYRSMGAQGSFLKASTGPLRGNSSGRGSYVQYQGGVIYYYGSTGAHPLTSFVQGVHNANGGANGSRLGLPVSDTHGGLSDGGW